MKHLLFLLLIVFISIAAICQETEKYAGTYSITGTYEVIDGPMYGWTGTIDSTSTLVKGYGSQIALLNFYGADSVMANIKQDSFFVIARRFDYDDCTGHISGSGRFSGDSIYYSSIMGGCRLEGVIEFKCSGKKLTTNVAEITSGQNKITIFPNPFTDIITVELSGTENFTIEILNSGGQKVFENNVATRNRFQVNLSTFPAGVYFVKAYSGKKVMVQKLMKH